MSWLVELFGTAKPIIAMCHLVALPGDPDYDPEKGMEFVVERAAADLKALQDGGVDAVMFSNEASIPYQTRTERITAVAMARVIGELKSQIRVPFGVNVLWDAEASVDLAVATGAKFVREIFSGVYGSDFGLWDTNAGATVRHLYRLGGKGIKLLFNIVPEAAAYLGHRDVADIARSTVFNCRPDALLVSGLTAGQETSTTLLQRVKEAVGDVPVFANTGVRLENIENQLRIADGAVVGTTFKRNGYIWNEVDGSRVRAFMEKVRQIRSQ
ncbi:MAG: BtpA/SgcQ family protein [Anaerolineales bacterium]|nr:BtpA/SgcQ family protein [Anaerolineales bacterium]MCS7249200.1 BtpA/SgcQ family protein [Anaerolineales bacterium]MDW8163013.1 BtpA/SgcQ family protein [Anaerolineales bacterium]MDW8447186.1 BtpA/SgcQ family protein [Anaerolineales bacterium]